MSVFALTLLFVAAAIHTAWNLLLKRAREKRIFTWWALVVGALCCIPLLLIPGEIPSEIWLYVGGSALAQAAYFSALGWAYHHGDFSLVYPLARGTAPALLALWAALFLGETFHAAAIIGLALIMGGLILVGGTKWLQRRDTAVGPSGIGAALLVAACISTYSAIDGSAVRLVHPALYAVLLNGATVLVLTPFIFASYRPGAIMAEWRLNWGRISAVGIATVFSYLLVLQAYAMSRVSYVGAVREISIVMAALAGWWWLNEDFGRIRTLGAICIFCGILVIAVAG